MTDTNKQQSWVGFALCCALGISLGAAGCRPLLPEAGLSSRVYDGQLGLASNILGEWYVVLPRSMWPEREKLRYVVVRFDGQRKLFYAKNNGPRSMEILPISPTPDAWLQRASTDKSTKIQALTSVGQIKTLSDPIGHRQPGGQVRWFGPVRAGTYIGNLWRMTLPADRTNWTIKQVLAGVAQVEVNAAQKTQATPWRQSKWSIGQDAAFVVLEGQAPTQALRVAVDGMDGSLTQLLDPASIKVIGARAQEEDKTKRTSVSWTMRQRLSQDNAQLYLRYGEMRSDLFAMRPVRWTSPVHMTPSWVEHPIQFKLIKTTTLVDLMAGYHALLEGMPVAAMQLMPKSGGVVFKQNVGHWRHTALLGMAHYTPWMRKGLIQGKTHWQAPDRVYGAQGYLYDGAFQRAEDEARFALEGFGRWKGSARELGRARAYGLLVHALGRQGRYKEMLKASKDAVLLYRKQGDAVHAAQVEWDTAVYAHQLKQPDAAVLLAQRARSRFYYANAPHPCAQVELFLAQLYLSLDQPKRARRMADYAVARMKYIKDAVGLNRARIVSLLIDDRLDPLRSPSFGLEEAYDAAIVLHDVRAQSLAATGLMLHRSLTRPKTLKRLLEIMPTGLATEVAVHTPDVWRSVYIACASLGRFVQGDSEFDRSNSESRYCKKAQKHVRLDRVLVASLTRRMKVSRLANQQQMASAQATTLVALLKSKSSKKWRKSHPVDVAMAYAMASGVLVQSGLVEDAAVMISNHLDPLLHAKGYARVASALDGAPWRAVRDVMWKRALDAALKSNQYDLWSALLIERATQLNFRQSAVSSSAHTKLNPRDRLMHNAMAAASTGKSVQLPSTSVLSVLDHMEVHTLEAQYAASHSMGVRLAQKIKRIRQLESGLSRQLLSTARAKLLAGQVMALDAQLAWQQLNRQETWRRAQRALGLLVEDDRPSIVRARARAVLLMGLSAQGKSQRRIVDRELARLTASDRRSAHRLHEVLGWRIMALIAYERGQNKQSILAMKRLASLGYALSPYGEVYGCGQVQMRFGFESVDTALDRAVICLQSNASTILAPQMALYALIHQPNNTNRHVTLQQSLTTYAQSEDGPRHNAWTRARAAYIAQALASKGALAQAAVDQLTKQQQSLPSSQWPALVNVCKTWLAHHQFRQAAACIQTLEARIKSLGEKAARPATIEVMALRVQYNNLRLLPQQNLYVQVPERKPQATDKTTSRGLMSLHQALMLSALMNGQHQLASKHVEQFLINAKVLGDTAKGAQTLTLSKSLGLSPSMDTVR